MASNPPPQQQLPQPLVGNPAPQQQPPLGTWGSSFWTWTRTQMLPLSISPELDAALNVVATIFRYGGLR